VAKTEVLIIGLGLLLLLLEFFALALILAFFRDDCYDDIGMGWKYSKL